MADTPSWLPSLGQVAEKMARFLPDLDGRVDGAAFQQDISPTQAQVVALIRSTGLAVNAASAGGITEPLQPVATDAVAYRVAARTIASFFPEADLDYVRQLEQWGDELLRSIGINLDDGSTGGGGIGDVLPATPVGYYPQVPCLPDVW